jgi:hypothetical protein
MDLDMSEMAFEDVGLGEAMHVPDTETGECLIVSEFDEEEEPEVRRSIISL